MPDPTQLRRCALAVAVLYDLDVTPTGTGLHLPGPPPLRVGWRECRRAIAGADPESPAARQRLLRWLRARCAVADLGGAGLAERVRPYGVPVDSPLHPGLDWVAQRVLGGTLDLGLAVLGLDPARPDDAVPLPDPLACAAGLGAPAWTTARSYLELMGQRAAQRLLRDPEAPLRPMGDCDVVTLLGATALRAALAGADGGMCTLAVPMRTRGWRELSRIDPAFVVAAAAATDLPDRGFSRALLVTAEELTLAAAGGRPADLPLRDPATADPMWV